MSHWPLDPGGSGRLDWRQPPARAYPHSPDCPCPKCGDTWNTMDRGRLLEDMARLLEDKPPSTKQDKSSQSPQDERSPRGPTAFLVQGGRDAALGGFLVNLLALVLPLLALLVLFALLALSAGEPGAGLGVPR